MFDNETLILRAAEGDALQIECALNVLMSIPALSIIHLIHPATVLMEILSKVLKEMRSWLHLRFLLVRLIYFHKVCTTQIFFILESFKSNRKRLSWFRCLK